MSGSMDNQPPRVVNVDAECEFAVIGFPNGRVDIKCKLSREEFAKALRDVADAVDPPKEKP